MIAATIIRLAVLGADLGCAGALRILDAGERVIRAAQHPMQLRGYVPRAQGFHTLRGSR